MSRARFWAAAAVLLGTMGTLQVVSSLKETQTWDEAIHLAAGYSYLKTGDYKLNHEHPPLFKLLAALAVMSLNPRLPLDDPSWKSSNQLDFGEEFLYRNHVPADTLLFRGRLVTIALTLLLGLLAAVWTRREFGAPAALFSLFLFAFDPNFIAHGRYITNDVMAAAFIFLTSIASGRALETGRARDMAIAGVALGLALVSKFSAVFMAPLLLVLYLFRWWQEGRGGRLSLRHLALSLVVVSAIGVATIALVYWPETVRTFRGPRLIRVLDRSSVLSEVLYQVSKRLGLPAHPYLLGLNEMFIHDQGGHFAYLLGRQSHEGWWYYFPVTFAVKTPTAVLLLALVCLGAGLAALPAVRRLRKLPLRWLVIGVPPAVYFLLSVRSHLNLGLRHLLPIYPFLFVALAAAVFGERLRRVRTPLVAVTAGLLLFESVRICPDYLAFFNSLSGGPGKGPEYLVDSNIDWGQDIKKLRRYLDSIGSKGQICLCYFGRANLTYYGIDARDLPGTADLKGRQEIDCIAAISATALHDVYTGDTSYDWLRERRPMAKVGYSIYVYDLRKRTM